MHSSLFLNIKFTLADKKIKKVILYPSSQLKWEMEGDRDPVLIDQIECWLKSYLKKQQPTVQLLLDLDSLPPFTKKAFDQLSKIPFGKLTSYQELAILSESPRAARAVGNACARNPYPLLIPCHRVITSTSGLGGFSQGISIKHQLLRFEMI